jgi:TrmH family RNA methyltransferase
LAQDFLSQIRIVLVETLKGGNLGSVARAMANCGLSDLVLVNPVTQIDEQARAMASKAMRIIAKAKIVPHIDEALNECAWAVGFIGCSDKRPKVRQDIQEIYSQIGQTLPKKKIALVFGREDWGLNKECMDRCRYLTTIPTHPQYPSLNLAQAVLLASHNLYLESQKHSPSSGVQKAKVSSSEDAEVLYEEREAFYRDWQRALLNIGFFSDKDAVPATMRKFRLIFERLHLNHAEIKMFRGLCRQFLWAKKNLEFSEENVERYRRKEEQISP